MNNKVRSARGEMVDFNLLKIKEQISSSPTTQDVRARQDFIEKKLHRRLKKTYEKKPKVDVAPVAVEPKIANEGSDVVETKTEVETTDAPISKKQKAR